MSKKELIMNAVENAMANIIEGNPCGIDPTIVYENTVGYIDRQYINISPDDITNKPMPWIIINNEGEDFHPLPSANFEATVFIHIACFVKATSEDTNLDSLMNSLQRDVVIAMITDETLGGTCAYLMPRGISTVPKLIYPYGGFVATFEIQYTFSGTNL
jgi:hypothetical protein